MDGSGDGRGNSCRGCIVTLGESQLFRADGDGVDDDDDVFAC